MLKTINNSMICIHPGTNPYSWNHDIYKCCKELPTLSPNKKANKPSSTSEILLEIQIGEWGKHESMNVPNVWSGA
jgi:hypothetical protein